MKIINLIFLFLYFLPGCFTPSLKAQIKDINSFSEFIDLLEKKDIDNNLQISNEQYLQFINDTPHVDYESENSFKVLLKRVNFVGILVNRTYDFARNKESVLDIYDWFGNQITEFDFGSGIYDDYYSEVYACKLKDGDTLECHFSASEGRLKETRDEKGNYVKMDYISLKDESMDEIFVILPDGNIEAIKKGEDDN